MARCHYLAQPTRRHDQVGKLYPQAIQTWVFRRVGNSNEKRIKPGACSGGGIWRPPSKSWRTFLYNYAEAITSIDLVLVPTITLTMLFGFVVLHHGRRQLVHVGATAHPIAGWSSHQISEAFPGTGRLAILFMTVTAPLATSSSTGRTPWAFGIWSG
jgi:hypothetical protein